MQNKHFAMRGISLLEIMLVLAITAVVLILSVRYYSNVKITAKTTQAIQQIGHIKNAINLYVQAQQGKRLTSSQLVNDLIAGAYLAPSDIMNPWSNGNNYKIQMVTRGSLAVMITIPSMDNISCSHFKERLRQALPHASTKGCDSRGLVIVTIPITFT